MIVAQAFDIDIAGQTHSFTFRPIESPAAIHLFARIAPLLDGFRMAERGSLADAERAAQEIASAVAPDEHAAQSAMRTMMRGPHDCVEWYYDVTWQTIVAITTEWIARRIRREAASSDA